MRTILKISTVLSWCNLILWGIFVLMGLLVALAFQNFGVLVGSFILSVIPLHSYAALQLRKSILTPVIPLSSQTPVGIRLIGFVALFLGIIFFSDGVAILQNMPEVAKLIQNQFDQLKVKGYNESGLRGAGIFALVAGLSVVLNVFVNFRLLRWYFFMKGVI